LRLSHHEYHYQSLLDRRSFGRATGSEELNDRLTVVTDLDGAGLTVMAWLAAVDLRRRLLAELIELDG
jgi:hypothetical protein